MQIRRLILKDVGPFADLDMRFPEGTDPERADVHLLVGPNGTGKSSVLAALAQCFAVDVDTGFSARARSKDTWVGVSGEGAWAVVSAFRGIGNAAGEVSVVTDRELHWIEEVVHRVFGGTGIDWSQNLMLWNAEGRQHWFNTPLRELHIHRSANAKDLVHLPGLSWAAFAYGGLRSVHGTPISGIVEQSDNPLRDACVLQHPEGTRPLVQWIANTDAESAMASRVGNATRAADRARSLAGLCDALGDVIGGKVELHVRFSPFSVTLSVDGAEPTPVDLLSDGLKSLLSWLGDLLMRLDRIPWSEPGPVTDRRFLLLLDEVEVHLHPAWQRKVIPVVERLFPNAQIIASTHSPFVIASASDAWIHRFRLEGGKAVVDAARPTAKGMSYPAILDDLMGVSEEFDVESLELLASFRELWTERLRGGPEVEPRLMEKVRALASRSLELESVVATEMHDLRKRLARKEGQPT